MKKFVSGDEQATKDAAVDQPPADSPSNRGDFTQSQSPFLSPPSEILEQIFCFLPADERVKVTRVCKPWRAVFLETPGCWRGLSCGHNASCFSSVTPPPENAANLFPLFPLFLREVRFSAAVPLVMLRSTAAVRSQIKEIPLPRLGLVLRYSAKLTSLDLSAMEVGNENAAAFR